jgi:hypothetical protein
LITMWFLTAIGSYLHITNKEVSNKRKHPQIIPNQIILVKTHIELGINPY